MRTMTMMMSVISLFEFSVPKLLSEGVVEKMFPLHNHDDLAKLRKNWVSAFFKKQPLGDSKRFLFVKTT